jgi:carbamoyl-phosphate synthase large subunit
MGGTPVLHVLGGGPWQLPTVAAARKLGLRVLVTDMYRERPAYALADMHDVIDITDHEATLDAARRHRADGVLCDSTDVGVPTAAWVAERLGLPGIGYETALNCTNKARMRHCVAQAGIPVPPHRAICGEADLARPLEAVGLPLVAKPVDNQSGRGVRIVTDAGDLAAAVRHARSFSRAGEVLLEGFIAGVEIIVDGFVRDGRAAVLAVAIKHPYADNPTVASRILYGSDWPLRCRPADVEAACAATTAAVGLREGLFHAEFIADGSRVVPIDFAARGGGVMIYRRVVPHVAGIDLCRMVIESAIGRPVRVEAPARRRAANIEFFRAPAGTLDAVDGVDDALRVPGVAAVHVNLEPGATIGPLTYKDDRLGFLVALGDTTEQVVAASEQGKSRLAVRLRGRGESVPVL